MVFLYEGLHDLLRQTAVNNDFVCGRCPGNDSKCVVVVCWGIHTRSVL